MHLLVVEDEKKVAQALREGLEADHYSVTVARTGEKGFFEASARDVDLIVLDLMLPDRSGLEGPDPALPAGRRRAGAHSHCQRCGRRPGPRARLRRRRLPDETVHLSGANVSRSGEPARQRDQVSATGRTHCQASRAPQRRARRAGAHPGRRQHGPPRPPTNRFSPLNRSFSSPRNS